MPIRVDSHKDHRILHVSFSDPWGLVDLKLMSEALRAYLDQAKDTTHRVLDLNHPRSIPPGILLQFRDSLVLGHPNNGEFAVIAGSQAVRTFAELAFRLGHFTRVRFFSTEDAAWAYLQSVLAATDDLARSDSSQ
jgi:hypothetical protein